MDKGQCYIETKNLDGETNLKIKQTHKEMMPLFKDETQFKNTVKGEITCELPNASIYKFEGTYKHPDLPKEISLSADNLLLRGCKLRNTEYAYGITIFQGHDTKIMMNSAKAEYKFS